VGSIPIARSNDPLGPTAKICPLAQASKMSPDGVRRGQWGPVMWQRKLLDTPLACKLMTRSSRWSKTHLGTGDKRDPDRTWEVKAIRTVRHKISRMPVEQIAHTLFVSRLEPLATMLEDLGWHSPYKARHYFISLAMQTPFQNDREYCRLSAGLPLQPRSGKSSTLTPCGWRVPTRMPGSRRGCFMTECSTHA
jgi:hypothetical protein